MIYLDNAASTKIHDDVLDSMIPYLKDQYGNPSSIHRYGRLARKAIEKARKQIAFLINADPSEILITSGGTESNNTALNGITMKKPSSHIITSSIEHDAILEPCKKLAKNGFDVDYVSVDNFGMVDPEDIENKITEKTSLISIMFGNNEVGTIQPISEIAKICNSHNVLFHTDAVQAIGKIPINVKELGIDLLSISSHKLYGPKGIGALYIKNGIDIDPIILGGGQEDGLRSGTENVASIVGFGKACEISKNVMFEEAEKITVLRDKLMTMIQENISKVCVNGSLKYRLPGNLNLSIPGTNNEAIIAGVPEIAISSGAACTSSTMEASHVLLALGLSKDEAYSSLRFGIGRFNTKQEIEVAANSISRCIKKLTEINYA